MVSALPVPIPFMLSISVRLKFISSAILSNPALLRAVCNDISSNGLVNEIGSAGPETSLDLARVYAYSMCRSTTKKRVELVKDCVFRDDVFKELDEFSVNYRSAVDVSRNWAHGREKTIIIELMKRYGVPKEIIGVYRELGNQWPAACCLARVNFMLMEKYYENQSNGSMLSVPG